MLYSAENFEKVDHRICYMLFFILNVKHAISGAASCLTGSSFLPSSLGELRECHRLPAQVRLIPDTGLQ